MQGDLTSVEFDGEPVVDESPVGAGQELGEVLNSLVDGRAVPAPPLQAIDLVPHDKRAVRKRFVRLRVPHEVVEVRPAEGLLDEQVGLGAIPDLVEVEIGVVNRGVWVLAGIYLDSAGLAERGQLEAHPEAAEALAGSVT